MTKKRPKKKKAKKKAKRIRKAKTLDDIKVDEEWLEKQSAKTEALRERRLKEQTAAKEFHTSLKALCDKHTEALAPCDAGSVVSNIMLAFDRRGPHEVDYDVGNFGVEDAMDTYLARKIEDHIPRLETIYKHLVDNKHTEDNSWEYGIDAYAFHIPDEKRRIFHIGRRSRNYLIFLKDSHRIDLVNDCLKEGTELHIRRIYDSYNTYYDKKGLNSDIKKGGAPKALISMDTLSELSDNIKGWDYVYRPDLAWYKKREFKLKYGDCRDPGYVLTLGGIRYSDRLDRCLGHY